MLTTLVPMLSLGAGSALAQSPLAERIPHDVLANVPVEVIRGDKHLRTGRPYLALLEYQKAAESVGMNPDIAIRTAEARFVLNQCDDALALAEPHRADAVWTASTSARAASCFARRGAFDEAVYWQQEAVLFEPGDPGRQTMLALFQVRLGDADLGARAFEDAVALDPDASALLIVQGALALDRGDFLVLDEVRNRLDATDAMGHPMGLVLGARQELDLGHEDLALRMGLAAMRRGSTSSVINAVTIEAARRTGDLDLAGRLVDRTNNEVQGAPALTPVRIRVEVDRGDLGRAERELAAGLALNPLDQELLASGWYLARARADTAAMADFAARWGRLNTSPWRRLDRLVPVVLPL